VYVQIYKRETYLFSSELPRRCVKGAIAVYDITNMASFNDVVHSIKSIKARANFSLQMVLIGNKMRKFERNRQVLYEKVSMKYGVLFKKLLVNQESEVEDAICGLLKTVVNIQEAEIVIKK